MCTVAWRAPRTHPLARFPTGTGGTALFPATALAATQRANLTLHFSPPRTDRSSVPAGGS
eukprot:2475078-Prymnesium_polylepis.1